ncbi:G-type lectin S-receptor-like serine/threonine-protein kinase At2g19130 [Cryptomeria japonica]|uniref:G-type lectin S-receptor-like serine/threonine-protein kinase At2g19130 n=1 Tax=Cryptomeria japonica TaxID=3369 RepID=UPI0025AD3A62|nr:G-type lectin S-receptor-like serine/threonine-protein kinase At2g19130 [Cryptomeria japonica]
MAMKCLVLAVTMIIAVNNCSSLALDGGDSLLLGDSLAGNQTILSKNDTFELGFFSPRGTNNWYIGIWYARMSPKVIVWVANRDNPVTSMPSILKFSSDGRLRLFDGKGQSAWSTGLGVKGSRAMITEVGNFIMLGQGRNKSEIVWESFAHPTDTWLPGMKLWKGMKLTSWKSSVDPASGLFSGGMDMSPGKTQILMVYNNSVPFWSSGEWTGNYFANVPEVYAPERFEASCVRVSPSRIYLNFSVFRQGHTLSGRIMVDEKGELKSCDRIDDGSWTQTWSTYRGQCSEYNICGAYGLCNANAVCSCVEGFTPKGDTQGWWSSGCARRRPMKCSVTEGTTDGFLESKNRNLHEEEAVSYNNETTMEGCRTACLNNCSCTAFSFVISDLPVCRLWFGDLFKMSVSSDSHSVFIRLAASELQDSKSERSRKVPGLYILLPSVAACCVILSLLLAAFILWKCRGQRKISVEEDVPIMLKTFTYKELRIATENFKHELGSGAFGSVFKGTLSDSTLVAVKRLEGFARAEKQFRAEINTIGIIQHVNLVRLCGFCVEGSQRLLVYAYMPNGSLNSSLFCEEEEADKVLDWKTRFEIVLGTARGLAYLHEECRDCIIHCDIKPENILLDDDFSPKIADFGLAKLVGRDFSRVLTTTRGTPGYLAPEWISGLPITPKVDVYSFGMTLLEIISGRRNLDLKVEERSRLYFPTWASSQIQRGNITGIVDARIASEANIEEVRRAAVVGGLCIQDDENQRPSMGKVVKILEGKMEAPAPQILRSLQVLVDQVEDDNSDTFVQHPYISRGSAPT